MTGWWDSGTSPRMRRVASIPHHVHVHEHDAVRLPVRGLQGLLAVDHGVGGEVESLEEG